MPSHLTPVPQPSTAQFPLPTGSTRPVPPTGPTGPVQRPEFEHWVELVRAGADVDEVVEKGGRSRPTVVKYLRQMLPLDERACPEPLVADRLREHLNGGEAHDWRAAMLRTPPPPPIQRIERKGVPGLTDEDLVTVVLALADRSGARDRAMFEEIKAEIQQRRLTHSLHEARRRELVRAGLDPDQAARAASVWVADHFALEDDYDRYSPFGDARWYAPYDRG